MSPLRVEDWEIIADNLSRAGWGCVSAIDSSGRPIWIADAHRITMSPWNLSNEMPFWLSNRSVT